MLVCYWVWLCFKLQRQIGEVKDRTRGIDFNDKAGRRQGSCPVVASVCCNEKSREGGKV
jgi:hypothetical protein